MADGVTTDQDGFSCGTPNVRVKLAHNLGVGLATVVKRPSRNGDLSTHLETPAAEEFECRVIVLNQLISPRNSFFNLVENVSQRLRNCWIVCRRGGAGMSEPFIGQEQCIGSTSRSL